MAKMGRPTKYSPELAAEICLAVSSSTDGLRKICDENIHFPSHKTIHYWRLDYPDFRSQYDAAKRNQAELLAEEIIEISNGNSDDSLVKISRSRLRIDARKWITCKLLPKIYGEKVQVEASVQQEDWVKKIQELDNDAA